MPSKARRSRLDPVLAINVRFRSDNAQKSPPDIEKTLKPVSNSFARMIVSNVALSMAKRNEKAIRKEFERSVEQAVYRELDRMAKDIARHARQPESGTGPKGALRIMPEDYKVMSDTMRGKSSTYNVSQSGIKWEPRDPQYVRRKKRKEWWDKTGKLQSYLNKRTGKYYAQAFGPVKVIYTPQGEASTFSAQPVSSSGSKGRLSERVRIGRVEVIALGNITPQDMPGLSSLEPMNSPVEGAGVARFLADTYYNRHTVKLMGLSTGKRVTRERKGRLVGYTPVRKKPKFKYERHTTVETLERKHRPWIDPFVSFYLTRAIPNAVYRRIEKTVEKRVFIGNSSGQKGKGGFGFSNA